MSFIESRDLTYRKICKVVDKICQAIGKNREDPAVQSTYAEVSKPETEAKMKFEAGIKEQPDRFVATMRHVGPYNEIGKAWEKFMGWAGQKGLLQFPTTEMLAVYHDDPGTVEASNLRADVCITVPEGTQVDGEVKTMTIPGGKFAVARVEIDASEYGAAWDKLMGEWMPANGATPDITRLCYELYLNDPEQHPEKKHLVDICEPVT